MAVYVDSLVEYPLSTVKPAARRFGPVWCHMTADTEAELHAMAARLGVPRSAYQGNYPRFALRHYDLIPSKRAQAIRQGAIEVEARTHLWERVQAEVAQEEHEVALPRS